MKKFVIKKAEISETEEKELCLRLRTTGGRVAIILPRDDMNRFLMGVSACELIGCEISSDTTTEGKTILSIDGRFWARAL